MALTKRTLDEDGFGCLEGFGQPNGIQGEHSEEVLPSFVETFHNVREDVGLDFGNLVPLFLSLLQFLDVIGGDLGATVVGRRAPREASGAGGDVRDIQWPGRCGWALYMGGENRLRTLIL